MFAMEEMMESVDSQRPLPQSTEVTRPFWEAAARRQLIHPRCNGCERAFFPPHLACPHCRVTSWSWVESAGRGEIYSFSVVHRAPQPGFTPPYVIAVVDLDEGFELMTNIVESASAEVRIGQRVRVAWHEEGDAVLPMFVPDEEVAI